MIRPLPSVVFLIFGAFLAGGGVACDGGGGVSPAWKSGKCNGHAALCDRPYNQVVYAGTHNSMASEARSFMAPNQFETVETQLAAGVRLINLDLYKPDDEVLSCHSSCEIGHTPLVDIFSVLEEFLRINPGEVVTVIFESYVKAEDVAAVVWETKLNQYLYSHSPGEPWPTLVQMLGSGRRLVLFTDEDAGSPSWYHDIWQFAWETPFHYVDAEEMDCEGNRGVVGNDLFILNHFLTNPWASPTYAEEVNQREFLEARAVECSEAFQKLPNFVLVDFYSIGNVLEVVNFLNGVEDP